MSRSLGGDFDHAAEAMTQRDAEMVKVVFEDGTDFALMAGLAAFKLDPSAKGGHCNGFRLGSVSFF